MIDTRRGGSTSLNWRAPGCPFTIQYSQHVLETIRLAVVEAFFLLPRGGAEVGGVLLGTFENQSVLISGFAPFDCEHAFGPSFTLSERDETCLRDLLSDLRSKGDVVVGWYHSHTRSGVFLSESDLHIHEAYFPEPWHVALVLRPSMFEPVRAGFFFRDSQGLISAQASAYEFQLHPALGMGEKAEARHPDAAGASMSSRAPEIPAHAAAIPQPEPADTKVPEPKAAEASVSSPAPQASAEAAPTPTPQAEAAAPIPPAPEPVISSPIPVALPRFLEAQTPPPRRWAWAAAVCVLGVALALGGVAAREMWLPAAAAVMPSIATAQSSADASAAKSPPDAPLVDPNAQLRRERDELAAENMRLKSLLDAEAAHGRMLEQQLERLRKQTAPKPPLLDPL
ncbi:MAG: Mov34/MPN/PAD-1 family protein [Acidobacteriia bacterium]|nr:Mov34/MPN/PAD-1 family protein [Terriglobia bacterium]